MSFWDDMRADILAHHYPDDAMLTLIRAWAFNPSIRILWNYRLQRCIAGTNPVSRLYKRWLWFSNCRKSGCYISPKARIEGGVTLIHPVGIVIGEGAVIKKGARIFQGVTLAVKEGTADQAPVIETGAEIFANAVVIGPITVGENAVIGAHSVVKKNVPKNSMAVGAPAVIKKTQAHHKVPSKKKSPAKRRSA